MASIRPKELGSIGPSKLGLDGEEDGWVFVKKQRVIIVLPSLPVPQHLTSETPTITSQSQAELSVIAHTQETAPFHNVAPEQIILQNPKTSQSQVEFRDGIADTPETTPLPVVPALPVTDHFNLQKPATSQPQSELRALFADTQETVPLHTVVPSFPLSEHFVLEKPSTFQSQSELRADTHETSLVHTILPSLPVPEHYTLQKPATSKSKAELRTEAQKRTTLVDTVMPSLPAPEHYTLQKPATSKSKAELRTEAQTRTTLVDTVMPSLPAPEHYTLQKPATSKSKAELRTEAQTGTTLVDTVMPSLPVPEHCTLQKPAFSKTQVELRAETQTKTTLVDTVMPSLPVPEHYSLQKPSTSQSRTETSRTTLVHTMVPSLYVPEHCTWQKPAASHTEIVMRDLVADTNKTAYVHTVEPEAYPDFTSVDKPEIVTGRNLTTRKAPIPRRSLHDSRMNPDRRVEIHRSRAGHKPIRFPRVMCSSIVMDNEKLRVLNLEKKIEKAGGLNEWVGSIGLGREIERMLRGERMSKFQMANLTMEKLKQMGAVAVGPRRKLIHAIRCVYHPHCLCASFN